MDTDLYLPMKASFSYQAIIVKSSIFKKVKGKQKSFTAALLSKRI